MSDSKYKFGNLNLKDAKEVSDYAAKVVSETEVLITNTIPDKIFSLETLSKEQFEIYDHAPVNCSLDIPIEGLKHQIDYSYDPSVAAATRIINDGVMPPGKKRKYVGQDNDGVPTTKVVPCNSKIQKMVDLLKPEIKHLIEVCERIQMWIQLLIPRIEDGNNFGVSIQEEVLSEVSRIQSECTGYLDYMSRYYITRAKLVSKVVKYPFVDDYRRSVREIDDKQVINMKISLNEIRNQYLLILDVISKNYEKIKTPRSQNTSTMY